MEILFLLGGAILGAFITRLIGRKNTIGTLKVDNSDPDSGPYLFLEIDCGKAHLIETSQTITLRVDLSQK